MTTIPPGKLDEFDLILACRDLRRGYLDFLVSMAHCPLVYVRGNHDDALIDNPPDGCICAEDAIVVCGGLRILGLVGSNRYRDGENMFTEKQMRCRVLPRRSHLIAAMFGILFEVSISTIRAWEKQWKEKGTLVPAPAVRGYKKIEPQRLKTYVQEHPDAYPKEIALEFNCCETAVRKAFERLGITRKKRRYITRNRTHKK